MDKRESGKQKSIGVKQETITIPRRVVYCINTTLKLQRTTEIKKTETITIRNRISLKTSRRQISQEFTNYAKSTIASNDNLHIMLQEAIWLLIESFNGQNTEILEIFLVKCKFEVKCIIPKAISKFLQTNQTRLLSKY